MKRKLSLLSSVFLTCITCFCPHLTSFSWIWSPTSIDRCWYNGTQSMLYYVYEFKQFPCFLFFSFSPFDLSWTIFYHTQLPKFYFLPFITVLSILFLHCFKLFSPALFGTQSLFLINFIHSPFTLSIDNLLRF